MFLFAANREELPLLQALHASGIATTSNVLEANLTLNAVVGSIRGEAHSLDGCGPIRQVKLSVVQQGRLVMHVIARGPTGACGFNVYESSASALAMALR